MTSNTLREWADHYTSHGISVIPIGRNKQPNHRVLPWKDGHPSWEEWQRRIATPHELDQWCKSASTTGLAFVCGMVSGGMMIFDFDRRDVMSEWVKRIGGREKLSGASVHKTGKGFQVTVRTHNPGTNEKLAMYQQDGKIKELIGVRGEGGYGIVPPSLHPSGARYEWVPGFDDLTYPLFLPSIIGEWIFHAKALTEKPLGRQFHKKTTDLSMSLTGTIIKKYNEMFPIESWLEEYGYVQKGRGWVRPDGKDVTVYILEDETGKKFTFHHNTADDMYGRPHDSFDWFRMKVHGDVFKDAIKSAAMVVGMEYEDESDHPAGRGVQVSDIRLMGTLEGNSIILTDDQETAEIIAPHVPTALGPHAVWPRQVLNLIDSMGNRFVVFGRHDDGIADRTALELDARVSDIIIPDFLKNHTIEEFARMMRLARQPVRI